MSGGNEAGTKKRRRRRKRAQRRREKKRGTRWRRTRKAGRKRLLWKWCGRVLVVTDLYGKRENGFSMAVGERRKDS